jgi:hypothetical protein
VYILFVVSALLGLALDVFSLVLVFRRHRKGRGPSGVPVVPLLLYLIPVLSGHPLFSDKVDLTLFVTLHVCLGYVFPYLDRQLVGTRR